MHSASVLASSSDINMMSQIAFELLANTFTAMFRHLSAFSIHSLLTLTIFRDVSREIVLFSENIHEGSLILTSHSLIEDTLSTSLVDMFEQIKRRRSLT